MNYVNTIGAQAAYNSIANAQNAVAQPLTIASALSRMEALNERLAQTVSRLSQVSNALGSLHPVEASPKPGQIPSGVVGRLNDVADTAHDRAMEIENLLSGIERALG